MVLIIEIHLCSAPIKTCSTLTFNNNLKVDLPYFTAFRAGALFKLVLETIKHYGNHGKMIGGNNIYKNSLCLFLHLYVEPLSSKLCFQICNQHCEHGQTLLDLESVRNQKQLSCWTFFMFLTLEIKAPAGLFGIKQAPAALRRKTGLGSPVAWFIHSPWVKANSDTCTCVMRIHLWDASHSGHGFVLTESNLKEEKC